MARTLHVYLTTEAERDLDALVKRTGMTASSLIAAALKAAKESKK